jgi:5,6,7,8-tetrahydromethanopterin hydro-lyase
LTADELDGRIGEGWSGTRPNGCHINLVIAKRGSPTAASIVGALAAPRPGHVPFLAILQQGTVVRPITVVVNKTPLGDERFNNLTWGAGQLGVAQGVLDAVADGVLPSALADSLVLLVLLWIDAVADDDTAIKHAARGAVRTAVEDAVSDRPADYAAKLAEGREKGGNAYYRGD